MTSFNAIFFYKMRKITSIGPFLFFFVYACLRHLLGEMFLFFCKLRSLHFPFGHVENRVSYSLHAYALYANKVNKDRNIKYNKLNER